MRIHDRYTILRLFPGFLLVLVVLTSLFSLTTLIDQLNDVGKGAYGWGDALLHVVLTTPHRALEVVPLAALLGGILALSAMAGHNELVALRAVGVSPLDVAGSALKAGAVLSVGALLVAEFVAPPLQRSAMTRRSFEILDPIAVQVEQGFWFQEGDSFVEVGRVLRGRRLADVAIYEIDETGVLHSRTRAREVEVLDSGRWLLKDVQRDVLGEDEIGTREDDVVRWESSFGPSLLEYTVLAPESLSVSDLFVYVRSLRARGQAAHSYEMRMWRYLGLPLAIEAMLLFAVPFVFALRRSSSGLRTTLGCLVGAAIYALDRIGGQAGLLFGLSPVVTALAPAVLVLAVSLLLLRRMR